MKKCYAFILTLAAICISTPARSQLVGLSYNSSQSAFQILSINPSTGIDTVLNANTGVGYSNNLFISNPSAGVAYAAGVNGDLYTYSLATGSVVASPSYNYSLQGLALGQNGNLVGLSYNSSQSAFQILSINPSTGIDTVLNANTGVGYSNNLFISNPSAGVAYAAGVNGDLYTYSLATGSVVASPSYNYSLQGLALGQNGNLVGLSYNSSQSAFQILSINPSTGIDTVLNANTGVGYSNNLFISNPSAGVAYAAGVNGDLYTYSLATGSVVASPSYNYSLLGLAISAAPEPNTSSLSILALCAFIMLRRLRPSLRPL